MSKLQFTSVEYEEITTIEMDMTPSDIPKLSGCIHKLVATLSEQSRKKQKSILISGNSMANHFILDRWGLRPSHRNQYRSLFDSVREACRDKFLEILSKGKLETHEGFDKSEFAVYKFDEIRSNLILGFVYVPSSNETFRE